MTQFNFQCILDCQLNFGIVLKFFLRVFEESEEVKVLVSNSAELGLTWFICFACWYFPSFLLLRCCCTVFRCGAVPAWTWTWYLIMLWGFKDVPRLVMPRRVSNPRALDSLNWSLLVYGRLEVCLLQANQVSLDAIFFAQLSFNGPWAVRLCLSVPWTELC